MRSFRQAVLIIGLLIMTSYCFNSSVQAVTQERPLQQKLLHYDIIIDVGHGGIDGGTHRGSLLEKNINLEVGKALYDELQKRKYEVGITRLQDYALSDDSPQPRVGSRHKRDLRQRALIAKGVNPALFISLHTNYSSHSGVKGPMIIHQDQAKSTLMAQLLQSELNHLTGYPKKEFPSRRYYLLQSVPCPCMIAEIGYISHPIEAKRLQDPAYQQQIAIKMANAIDQYFHLYPYDEE
ncbi:N-acetylmuramoyl-L-alanine amidase family protein [Caldalkalibacillus salinus]|uniref:N-acetylmuramoyl-L-alanine amidase family protein n=1 Tax=Caldalkalibacillus salinus TaxID=2803787 RepID=UPI0019220D65|nr:N-acetylmuramoyl-L-alanine amidase [Caldalkalibacillus salinus]